MWPHRGFPTGLCDTSDIEHCKRFHRRTLKLVGWLLAVVGAATQERAVALDKAAPHGPDVTLEDHYDGSQGDGVSS